MTLRAIFGRRWMQTLGLLGAAAAGYLFALATDRVFAQPSGGLASNAQKSWVAMIYGNVPVTREDLGEFLIARGGYEKVELVVNKRIIEIEAAQKNITVTPEEIRGALEEDIRGLGISFGDFKKHVLPRYGKTLYEWTEDVIKPRLMLGKMCRDRVTVTDTDLKRLFENKYGEKRQAKIIRWPKEEVKAALRDWEEARKGDTEFDSIARRQADPSLAGAAGLTQPVGRNAYDDSEGKKDEVERVLFSLKVGEISQLFQTPAGNLCVKCVAIIPPDTSVKLEQVKSTLEKEVYDRKLSAEIPKFFTSLKEKANPQVFLKGPPTAKEFEEGVKEIMKAGGVAPPAETKKP
jgi:PPIC-type peptidyl-prolyl cis-trans isomerase-like protein